MTALEKMFVFFSFRMHALACCYTPSHISFIMASFLVEAMVRGYHVYKNVWTTVVGEELPCQREDGNRADPFAVAVIARCP